MRALPALVVLLFTGSLHAEGKDAASESARDHFRHGLSYVERGDLDAALQEFEAAYVAQPHPSVLYNIAQAQLGLGQTLQAIDAFERYLREGGEQLSPERRQEVMRSLTTSRSRLGQLELAVIEPALTRLWLDGKELRPEQWAQPIPLVAGEHRLIYSVSGGAPIALPIQVSRGGSSRVRVQAEAVRPSLARVAIQCSVPGVNVELTGNERLTTPIAKAILAPAGAASVRFSRPGYRTVERALRLEPAGLTSIDCALAREPALPFDVRASLRVFASPRDAETLVDGELYLGGELPAGPHWVTLRRDGFESSTKTLQLFAGKTFHYSAELQRTAASRVRFEKAKTSRRWLGVGLSGLGAGLLATAGGLFVWNNQRYQAWESNQGTSTFAHNMSSVVSLQRVDDLCIGLTLLGAVASASGVFLFATPPKEANP